MDLIGILKIYSKPHDKKANNKYLNKYFIQVIDDLQSILDKKKFVEMSIWCCLKRV